MADDRVVEKGRVPMEPIIEERVIPPGEVWARVVTSGQALRIVDLEGKQAVDFLCYNAANPEERYNAADTMKYARTIFLTRGHGVYSDMGRRLFTIVEDTCGRHDTIGGCCSAESNELRYGVKDTPSCRSNFVEGLSRPGDYVDLRAEMDTLAVISNCPQTRNPCNGFKPTPIRVMVRPSSP